MSKRPPEAGRVRGSRMKHYGIIAVGSGAAASVVGAWLDRHPRSRAAIIDKDAPGGICLTRGCIPSKMLTSVADVARTIDRAGEFGLSVGDEQADFGQIMLRLHAYIDPKIRDLSYGLTHTPNLDYFHEAVEFVGPSTLRTASGIVLRSRRILLGLGSEPIIPDIAGLREVSPLTTDEIFEIKERPGRLAILGGGYIAAEFAHFFSAIGTAVTVIGRNPRLLPEEDPEISEIVSRNLGSRARLLLGRQPDRVQRDWGGQIVVHLPSADGTAAEEIAVDRILIAVGRGSTAHLLHPERAGVRLDDRGWVAVNEYLETDRPGIWALGDATGVYPFKHKANYDASVIQEAIVLGRRAAADYHAVPHAVFTDPEVASVGLNEEEAVEKYGSRGILVGRYFYEDTAKGHAIGAGDGLVKVLVRPGSLEIVGAHIVGPQASVLIQEVVTLLYTPERSARPIVDGMHIHPALSEVVERAFRSLAWPRPREAEAEKAESRGKPSTPVVPKRRRTG